MNIVGKYTYAVEGIRLLLRGTIVIIEAVWPKIAYDTDYSLWKNDVEEYINKKVML